MMTKSTGASFGWSTLALALVAAMSAGLTLPGLARAGDEAPVLSTDDSLGLVAQTESGDEGGEEEEQGLDQVFGL